MSKLKHHPLINDLPVMTDEEFALLKNDIADTLATTGRPFRHKIVFLDKMILDGRHRCQAASELGIKLSEKDFEDFDPKWGDPFDWVISQMLHRTRTPSMKAVEAEAMIDHWPASRGEGRKHELVAKKFGISATNIELVRMIRRKAPKLYDSIRSGRVKVSAARNQFRHLQNAKSVRKLRETAIASLDASSCELRYGDNVKLMRAMKPNTVRIVFADPPYNQGWTYREDPTGDKLLDDEYLAITREWMTEAARLLADDGSLFVVIDDNYSDHFGIILRSLGLHRRKTIVWWERFGNYISGETGMTPACRYIHYFTKTDRPLFNTVECRDESERQRIGDARGNDTGKVPDNVWPASRINGTTNERVPWKDDGQAPQLPVKVPERCILLASQPGDLILDPFNGNGITGIAALNNGRRYIGLDRDKKGLERSRRWISQNTTEGNR